MLLMKRWVPSFVVALFWVSLAFFVGSGRAWSEAAELGSNRPPLFRTVDLAVNESQELTLADGTKARVKLLNVAETRDSLHDAVRQAEVKVEVNGRRLVLNSAFYHLPVSAAGVQIDCPITRGCLTNNNSTNV
jgi:hypothetical protein